MVAVPSADCAPPRRKPGPKPTGKTPQTAVRLDAEITDALDRLVDGDAIVSRSEAIRVILRQWLTANQMLKAKP